MKKNVNFEQAHYNPLYISMGDAKVETESMFTGYDYTMVRSVSIKNMLLHLQLEILYSNNVLQIFFFFSFFFLFF